MNLSTIVHRHYYTLHFILTCGNKYWRGTILVGIWKHEGSGLYLEAQKVYWH